jgi:serine/threonine-protein kinase
MAPEVVRRRQADKRLDIFSFGITAYEICTGRAPWPKGSTGKAAMAHDTPPNDIREAWPEIPAPLATAIMACLSADPEKRPESMAKFLTSIAAVKV